MAQQILLSLYAVALLTSMAGMEIFGWLVALYGFGSWLVRSVERVRADAGGGSFRLSLVELRIGSDFWRGPDLWLWGYVVICLLSLVFSPVEGASLSDAGKLRWVVLLYGVSLAWRAPTGGSVERVESSHLLVSRVVNLLFVMALITAVYSVLQFFFGIEFFRSREVVRLLDGVYRPTGFYNMALTFAYAIGLVGLVGAGRIWALPFRDWYKPENALWTLAALAGAVGCLVSLTRGSWLAMVGASVIVLLMVRPKRLVYLAVGVAALLVLGLSFNSYMRTRIASIVDLQESTNVHRQVIWQSQWEVVKAHPWLGVGYTNSGEVAPAYFEAAHGLVGEKVAEFYQRITIAREDFQTHAHNNFLYTWAGSGIFALICYLMFSWYFLRESWVSYRWYSGGGGSDGGALKSGDEVPQAPDRLYASLALGIFGAQIFFHIGGVTECNFFDGEVNHNLVFLWALAGGVLFRQKRPGTVGYAN